MKPLNRQSLTSRQPKSATRQAESQARTSAPTPLKPEVLKQVGGGDGPRLPIPRGGW
jgi:hypothetical protein